MFNLIKNHLPLLLFLFSLSVLFRAVLLDFHPDFSAYYYGSKISFSGANPFPDSESYHTPNVYPMFVYVLFFPFTFFDFVLAQKIWVFLSIIFLVLFFYFTFAAYKKSLLERENLLLTSFIFLTFFPTKFTLGMAQINLFILLLTVLFLYCYHLKKEVLASVFLGISIAAKFFPPLLFAYLFVNRKVKIIFLTILIFGLSNLIGVFVFGPEHTIYFYRMILPDLLSGWKGDYYNQALSGLLTREIDDVGVRTFLKMGLSVILFIVSIVAIFKKAKDDVYHQNLIFGLLITLSVLINTFSWQHHFVWLLFPFISVYLFLRKKNYHKKFFAILAASYILVAVNFPSPNILPSILQSHVFFGGLLLWGLVLYLILNNKVK